MRSDNGETIQGSGPLGTEGYPIGIVSVGGGANVRSDNAATVQGSGPLGTEGYPVAAVILKPGGSPFTPGSVIFAGPGGVLSEDNSNFFWNDSTDQLLLGGFHTTTPSYSFVGDSDTGITWGGNQGEFLAIGNGNTLVSFHGGVSPNRSYFNSVIKPGAGGDSGRVIGGGGGGFGVQIRDDSFSTEYIALSCASGASASRFAPSSASQEVLQVRGIASQTGPLITLYQVSNAPASRKVGQIDGAFASNVDATWQGEIVLYATDHNGDREVLRGSSDGSQALFSVFGTPVAAQQTGGAATAGGTYGATEQAMLQTAYDCLRTFGYLT